MGCLLYLIWLCFCWRVCAKSQNSSEIEQLIYDNRHNDTALSTIPVTGWVMSPTVRGTLDIVLTSVVTLLACIWSVLHLNIPADTGRYSAFLSKLPWVFIALLFPDTVIAVAVGEFLEACSLRKTLADMKSNDTTNTMPEYNLQFCFFVVMGGFQVSVEDIQPGESCLGGYDCPKRVALSPSGFLELMTCRNEERSELLNNPKLLEDRNKANVFQKIVIMTQITWMAAQCLVRKRQGLTIAILEIHVMAHVLCAVVIYIFWFKKPMDINQPEILELQSVKMQGFLALAIQSQWCPEAHTNAFVFSNGTTDNIEPSSDTGVALRDGWALECGVRYKQSDELPEQFVLSPSDVKRIERAASYITLFTDFEEPQNDEVAVFPRDDYLGMCMQTGSNIPSPHVPQEYKWLRIPVALSGTWMGDPDNRNHITQSGVWRVRYLVGCLGTLLYGGIHLSALPDKFPSGPERTIWLIACILICALVPAQVMFNAFMSYICNVEGSWNVKDAIRNDAEGGRAKEDPGNERQGEGARSNQWRRIFRSLVSYLYMLRFYCVFVMFEFGLLNLAARTYVLVESFLDVRCLAIGSFALPAWLQMLPHV